MVVCLICLDIDEIGLNLMWGEGFGSVNIFEGVKCSRFRKVVVFFFEYFGDVLIERFVDYE